MSFDSQGKLVGIDNKVVEYNREDDEEIDSRSSLLTSKELNFLKEDKIEGIENNSFWSLYSGDKKLEPLKFTNGKTQEDVVKEVSDLIKKGTKIILIHGMCGTGKSAIALNIAREVGRASIVVPIKSLQRQYENDYTSSKYVIKKNGHRMKIAVITGRENHDSMINAGVSCADPFLPDTIKINEKNYSQLKKYYNENPLIQNKMLELNLKTLRRISIAPANPYWSPIIPKEFDVPLNDAKKRKYMGLNGKEFIFYHRKEGCSYYDQYLSYINADVIVFNSAKYKIEMALDRKPETEIDIIDEADEFLDNFSNQQEINMTKLIGALKGIFLNDDESQKNTEEIIDLIRLEEKNKEALGIDKNKIYSLSETKIGSIINMLLKNTDLEIEASLDDSNYINRAIEIGRNFYDFFDETYLTYEKREGDLIASLVTTNLSKKLTELVDKTKVLILMSGTLHSSKVLRDVFGLNRFEIVDAESKPQGIIENHRTGKEFDCRYSNFSSAKYSRKDYLLSLSACLEKAKRPVLVHVNSFEDLPTEVELYEYGISNIMSRERLRDLQANDKNGKSVDIFKNKLSDFLFTTKCSRGVDFPGDTCNSVVFTKYPNPNVNGTFWKILQKTHPNEFWDFYRDKAKREFLQRLYRAVRSREDHVFVLSPDIRVFDAVRELQKFNN